jgi:hypothetical protein
MVGCALGRTGRHAREGSILLHAVIGLLVLLTLSLTLLLVSRAMVGHSLRRLQTEQAQAAAEAACARGMAMLEQGAIPAIPYTATNLSLGRRKMDLRVVSLGSTAGGGYSTAKYEIRGTGYAGNRRRAVALGTNHDSFLSYSRFLQTGGVGYNGGATLTGKVYCGGDLTLSGSPVHFYEDVAVTGRVVNRSNGVFHKALQEGVAPIALTNSMDVATYRTLAQQAGMYFNAATATIDLSLFDFSTSPPKYGTTTLSAAFNGVIFGETDVSVSGVLEGRSVSIVAGDDIIISDNIRTGTTRSSVVSLSPRLTFSASAGVESVQTVGLNSLMSGIRTAVTFRTKGSKWQRLVMYLREDGASIGVATIQRPPSTNGTERETASILARKQLDPSLHTYTAEIHYWSTGAGNTIVWVDVASGDPVNVDLIAKDYVYLSASTPRVLTVDAALFARDNNWRPLDDTDGTDSDGSHWTCTGTWDLDQDGTIETLNEDGFNEANCGSSTWVLNINGPIVTKNGGSAGAWSHYGDSLNKNTRRYNYDDDIVYFQPPQFPIILSRWAVLYWREG